MSPAAEPERHLTLEEESALCARYQATRDDGALMELVERHGGWIFNTVRKATTARCRWLCVSYDESLEEDYYQLAVIGVMEAAERFDSARGNRFITYAHRWVRHEISRHRYDCENLVRVPVHAWERAFELSKAIRRFRQMGLPSGESEERARTEAGLSLEKFEDVAATLLRVHRSLDEVILHGRSSNVVRKTLADVVEQLHSREEEWSESLLSAEERREFLWHAVRVALDVDDVVTERERDILERRVMREDGEQETLLDIGKVYGLTGERIRQNEADALRKLRSYFLGDRRVVQLLRDEGWVSEREAGRAMDAIENKEWMLGQQRSAAMMSNRNEVGGSAVEVVKKRWRVVVVHGAVEYYEKNGIARKLDERGMDVVQVHTIRTASSVKRQDWRGADFVVFVNTSIDHSTRASVREEGKQRAVRVFEVSHRTSDWAELEYHVGYSYGSPEPTTGSVRALMEKRSQKPHVTLAAPVISKEKGERLREMTLESLDDYLKCEEVKPAEETWAAPAPQVPDGDVEQLARMWEEEARAAKGALLEAARETERARAEAEAVRKSSGAVARDQLAEDLARKEKERKEAIREKEDVLKRLEAVEAELRASTAYRREDAKRIARFEEKLKTANDNVAVRPAAGQSGDLDSIAMRKLRAIQRAHADGVISDSERDSKFAEVLK